MKKENFKRTRKRESGQYAQGWDLIYLAENYAINISCLTSLVLLPICLISGYIIGDEMFGFMAGLMVWMLLHLIVGFIISEIIAAKKLPIIKSIKKRK